MENEQVVEYLAADMLRPLCLAVVSEEHSTWSSVSRCGRSPEQC